MLSLDDSAQWSTKTPHEINYNVDVDKPASDVRVKLAPLCLFLPPPHPAWCIADTGNWRRRWWAWRICVNNKLSSTLRCRHFEYINHYSTLNSLFVNIISNECAEMRWTCHGTGSSLSYQSVGVASSHSEHSSVQGLVPPYVTSCQHSSWPSVMDDAVHSACPAPVTHQRVHKLTSLLNYTQHVSLTFTST